MSIKSMTFLGLTFACLAQQPGAKALFYEPTVSRTVQSSQRPLAPKPAPGGAPVAPEVTGLRYWIELQTAKGQLLRVTTSHAFQSGDRIRLHVESNVSGTLQILQSQDGGRFSLLFPNGKTSGRVEKLRDTVLPSSAAWFRFDAKPGDIRLMMMLQADPGASPAPSPTTQEVAVRHSPPAPPPPAAAAPRLTEAEERQLEERMRAQIGKLKGSKALMIEEDDRTEQKADYIVVDTKKSNDVEAGLLAVEFRLLHR